MLLLGQQNPPPVDSPEINHIIKGFEEGVGDGIWHTNGNLVFGLVLNTLKCCFVILAQLGRVFDNRNDLSPIVIPIRPPRSVRGTSTSAGGTGLLRLLGFSAGASSGSAITTRVPSLSLTLRIVRSLGVLGSLGVVAGFVVVLLLIIRLIILLTLVPSLALSFVFTSTGLLFGLGVFLVGFGSRATVVLTFTLGRVLLGVTLLITVSLLLLISLTLALGRLFTVVLAFVLLLVI